MKIVSSMLEELLYRCQCEGNARGVGPPTRDVPACFGSRLGPACWTTAHLHTSRYSPDRRSRRKYILLIAERNNSLSYLSAAHSILDLARHRLPN